MIVDIHVGAGSAFEAAPEFAVLGDDLYFAAFDVENGNELRKFNTANESLTTYSLATGLRSSNPAANGGFHVVGQDLIFSAEDLLNGNELRRFNTQTETFATIDITPGSAGSSPGEVGGYTTVGNTLYFTATDADLGREPHVLDLSTNSIIAVVDVNVGPEGSDSGEFGGFVELDGNLFFNGIDAEFGNELHILNTSFNQVTDTVNFFNGARSSNPGMDSGFAIIGTRIYFAAEDTNFGRELRSIDVTDGQITTHSLENTSASIPGLYGSLLAVDNRLIYTGFDSTSGFELRLLDTTTGLTTTACLLYTSPSPRDATLSRMPSSA